MIKRIILMAAMLAMAALAVVAQQPMTAAEQAGITAIQNAAKGGIDQMAAAVDDFVAKFPKSPASAYALTATADQYEARGNSDKAMSYYQRTLEVDPRNYYAMLMMASEIAKGTKEFEIDEAARTAKLNKAEKYANDGLAILATATKPNPNGDDQQWANLKKDDESRGHEALGMIAMARKKYDTAVSEFKKASEAGSGPSPSAMIRLSGAYNEEKKYAESIAVLEKVLAIKDLPDAYKSVATNMIKVTTEAKDGKK
jgi:tetratricopeptide (TPR) repeat protein